MGKIKNLQVVWFKRDLRVHDHEALAEAAKAGPVLPLYIMEPDLWAQPVMAGRHYDFLSECLEELNESLSALGQSLVIRVGEAVDVLQDIHEKHGITALRSHQETWTGWTYERDKAVKRWASAETIPWHEPSQFGVIRGLKNRDGWAAKWNRQMKKPQISPPEKLTALNIESEPLPTKAALNIAEDICPERQKGGQKEALKIFEEFLYERGEYYQKEMSSPVTAYESCSRLSPYLAFGCVSMREISQRADQRVAEIKALPRGEKGKWPGAMRALTGRLRWHCHFIQKLEDDPRIEYENFHHAYDGLRPDIGDPEFDREAFEAWSEGRTGFPFVDACMRALKETGWVNFRMRAMLVSFASYQLWLHWRPTSKVLARLFTDYEPGIHYSQFQMQSGTTGINTIRIYSPIKQSKDQDPDGQFIKRYVPELRDMPAEYIHEPWTVKGALEKYAPDYPRPIVDEKTARKEAAAKIFAIRKGQNHRDMADQIQAKHGSRRSGLPQQFRDRKSSGSNRNEIHQDELPL